MNISNTDKIFESDYFKKKGTNKLTMALSYARMMRLGVNEVASIKLLKELLNYCTFEEEYENCSIIKVELEKRKSL